MTFRVTRLALLAALVQASSASPAAYADKSTTGFNTGQSGVVVSRWTPTSSVTLTKPNVQVLAQCEYVAVPEAGGLRVALSGTVTVAPLDLTEVPSSVTVTCEVNDTATGGDDAFVLEQTQSGAAAVTAGSYVLPIRPLTVCVSSSATSTGGTVTNSRACRLPDVLGGSGSGTVHTTSRWTAIPVGTSYLVFYVCEATADPGLTGAVALTTTVRCAVNDGPETTATMPGGHVVTSGTVVADLPLMLCSSASATFANVATSSTYTVSAGPQCVTGDP